MSQPIDKKSLDNLLNQTPVQDFATGAEHVAANVIGANPDSPAFKYGNVAGLTTSTVGALSGGPAIGSAASGLESEINGKSAANAAAKVINGADLPDVSNAGIFPGNWSVGNSLEQPNVSFSTVGTSSSLAQETVPQVLRPLASTFDTLIQPLRNGLANVGDTIGTAAWNANEDLNQIAKSFNTAAGDAISDWTQPFTSQPQVQQFGSNAQSLTNLGGAVFNSFSQTGQPVFGSVNAILTNGSTPIALTAGAGLGVGALTGNLRYVPPFPSGKANETSDEDFIDRSVNEVDGTLETALVAGDTNKVSASLIGFVFPNAVSEYFPAAVLPGQKGAPARVTVDNNGVEASLPALIGSVFGGFQLGVNDQPHNLNLTTTSFGAAVWGEPSTTNVSLSHGTGDISKAANLGGALGLSKTARPWGNSRFRRATCVSSAILDFKSDPRE